MPLIFLSYYIGKIFKNQVPKNVPLLWVELKNTPKIIDKQVGEFYNKCQSMLGSVTMNFKAAIFDFDGTIADSMSVWADFGSVL